MDGECAIGRNILLIKTKTMKTLTLFALIICFNCEAQIHLVSRNPLPYNSGVTAKDTIKIKGKITNVSYRNNFSTIMVDYNYSSVDDNVIHSGTYILKDSAEINAAMNAVINYLPPATNEYPYTMMKYYIAFKYLMAQTWGINPNDVLIITE